MKRFGILFACLFLIVFIAVKKSPPDVSRLIKSHFKHFKRDSSYYGKKFKSKIRTSPPVWMEESIEEDLSFLSNRKITLDSLNKTEAAIRTSEIVIRYRIVDNRLYASKNPKLGTFEPIDRFQKALLTLCKLTSLPSVDFLVNHEDGTGVPFYLTENKEDQAPLFGWAKLKTTPYLILIPDYRSVSTLWFDDLRKLVEGKRYAGKKPAWAERENKAFWRGAYSEPVHRLRIAQLSKTVPDLLDAGLTDLQSYSKPSASYEEHMQYKYLPVLDGVMCSYPGYQWRLLSDSLTLKQESDQIQWFYRALKPNFHYIPIANDLSDLIEKIEWAKGHDRECEQIAQNGKNFALENLMFDDVYLYLYLALSRYASHLDNSFDREFKKTAQNPDWELIRARK